MPRRRNKRYPFSGLKRAFACAAVHPGLRSMLVFDADADALRRDVVWLEKMLAAATDRRVRTVHLSSTESEDDLWGTFALPAQGSAQMIVLRRGLLRARQNELLLVFIPELSRLSLAAKRAATMLATAEVAHLERHGEKSLWQPDICWLAGCRSSEAGRVSRHLLDRFVVRVSLPDDAAANSRKQRVSKLTAMLATDTENDPDPPRLSRDESQHLQRARRVIPQVNATTRARIIEYLDKDTVPGFRRVLTLARLAAAHAQLRGRGSLSVSANETDVDAAAALLGLQVERTAGPQTPRSPAEEVEHEQPPGRRVSGGQRREEQSVNQQSTSPREPSRSPDVPASRHPRQTVAVQDAGSSETRPPVALPVAYKEDGQVVDREAATLCLPVMGTHEVAGTRGPIIGVRRASDLFDIAWVSTLLEAAKYQPIRRKFRGAPRNRLLLSSTDLRSYRRAPVTESLLVLLIDYTALRACRWEDALLPFLRWAYVQRAHTCLVQVGAETAGNPLKAARVMAPNLMVPRLLQALAAHRGKATPLAHGLELAIRTLDQMLDAKHVWREAKFVLITDGRGNVPLDASRAGVLEGSVADEGVLDALQVARAFRQRSEVTLTFLDPQPRYYAHLSKQLAQLLGAEIVNLAPREEAEV